MSRSTTRLFKRSDDSLPIAQPSALFGRRRRSQTEGGGRAEVKPWARFTAKVTATLTSLGPAPLQEQPHNIQDTAASQMMTPRRQPVGTGQDEAESSIHPFALPYNHPFLQEMGSPEPELSRRASLRPPPRTSPSNLSIHSSASDLTSVSIPHTPTSKHAPSFKHSTSPARKFPTPLPTPPPSAKHTTFAIERRPTKHMPPHRDERIRRSWSGHPFAVRPPGSGPDSNDSEHEAYDPDLGFLLGGTEEPQGMVAEIFKRLPPPERLFNPPEDHPFTGGPTTRPRRGTFGSDNASKLDEKRSKTKSTARHSYWRNDADRYEYEE
ncbi:hypothetical protein CcaverHIS631_0200310 [Cutaneotrichosporon cavernicola]|nr:hypothetical protein CcaverHIS631_0200310 [Cutaneotrichosporon cavernicola]